MSRRIIKSVLIVALLAWSATMVWQTHKPLPPGVHITASAMLPENTVRFYRDLTYRTPQGRPVSEQQIFDAVFAQIDAAQHFIVLDYFLINDDMGGDRPLRALSRELVDRLLARKRALPALQVLLMTDPINDVYGGSSSKLFLELQQAGIDVVRTDLTRLRDSNPGYSAVWRGLFQWWGNDSQGGWLLDPFDPGHTKVTLRSWLRLLNLKANHRKVIVSDTADGQWMVLVTSANPHDASSAHSNVALQFTGGPAEAVFRSEVNIAKFSGWRGELSPPEPRAQIVGEPAIEVSYLTEGAIRARVLKELAAAQRGDRVRMAMFYLSERAVVEALKSAAQRGVLVQLILDPNKDAFGIQKDGVPNRPVAYELIEQSKGNLDVRWYRTHGEQFHTKLLMVQHGDRVFATLGSANFTRRNLDDYNLEANVALSMQDDTPLAGELTAYFERLWRGDAINPEYTAPFGAYRDDSTARYWRYRLMEATGLSSF